MAVLPILMAMEDIAIALIKDNNSQGLLLADLISELQMEIFNQDKGTQ